MKPSKCDIGFCDRDATAIILIRSGGSVVERRPVCDDDGCRKTGTRYDPMHPPQPGDLQYEIEGWQVVEP